MERARVWSKAEREAFEARTVTTVSAPYSEPVIASIAGNVMARFDAYDWRPIDGPDCWLHAFVSVDEAESCYRSSAFEWTDGL
jgi:hypothetical protein